MAGNKQDYENKVNKLEHPIFQSEFEEGSTEALGSKQVQQSKAQQGNISENFDLKMNNLPTTTALTTTSQIAQMGKQELCIYAAKARDELRENQMELIKLRQETRKIGWLEEHISDQKKHIADLRAAATRTQQQMEFLRTQERESVQRERESAQRENGLWKIAQNILPPGCPQLHQVRQELLGNNDRPGNGSDRLG